MTLDKRITEFVNSHPANWQETRESVQLILPSSVLYVTIHDGQLTFGVNFIGGSSMTVHHDQLFDRIAKWETRRIIERAGTLDHLPSWLVEPVRVELRRRANELLAMANTPTQTEMKQ